MPEGVLLDTSFFIRFLNEKDKLFTNADKYYRFFLDKKITMFISTISIAEFTVGAGMEQLPLKNLIVLPFNITHAVNAGKFAKILYEMRKESSFRVDERTLIINDAKLFAQAHCEIIIKHFITSDQRSLKLYNHIKSETNLDFAIADLHENFSDNFGLLDL